MNIQMLDCTLRDGAYIVDSKFGTPVMKGLIKKLQGANTDIIECGWLKMEQHKEGTTFFHLPDDLKPYIPAHKGNSIYAVMIDWNRYDLSLLPENDGQSIDAIRVVFPRENFREGIALGKIIKEKGYKVFFQAADTLAYSNADLIELVREVNNMNPDSLAIVDTFGAMYQDDLLRIIGILDGNLNKGIKLGFHSHNNQQLSFSLTIQFAEELAKGDRDIIVDASLCGMGRGAGNTNTELIANYLNKYYKANYDMNVIMDAIDTYMNYFMENYRWGYSIPYFIAGMYSSHVNNISYLMDKHGTNAKELRSAIDAISANDRRKYDYELLDRTYLECQDKEVDDEEDVYELRNHLTDKNILLISPGKSIVTRQEEIKAYQMQYKPVVIGINVIYPEYQYDYIFFSNQIRYDYANDVYSKELSSVKKIVTSNVKTKAGENEAILNFNRLIKRGWEHFDNSTIMCLRLMNRLQLKNIAIAGFDGFSADYAENYCDIDLPPLNSGKIWNSINNEIKDMFQDFRQTTSNSMEIYFVTDSIYNV